MSEKRPEVPPQEEAKETNTFTWQEKAGLSAKTPIGLFGIGLTTVCLTMTILGLLGHISGLIQNPYAAIITFLVFPAGAVFGLFLILSGVYLTKNRPPKGQKKPGVP